MSAGKKKNVETADVLTAYADLLTLVNVTKTENNLKKQYIFKVYTPKKYLTQ